MLAEGEQQMSVECSTLSALGAFICLKPSDSRQAIMFVIFDDLINISQN
jgi:hypothetical protein